MYETDHSNQKAFDHGDVFKGSSAILTYWYCDGPIAYRDPKARFGPVIASGRAAMRLRNMGPAITTSAKLTVFAQHIDNHRTSPEGMRC